MLRVINNDIHLTKGDTGYIALTIKNSKGNKYIVRDGDTLTLTVKKNLTNAEVIKKQVNANEVISILPSDTQDLNVGRYKYDIQLNTSLGEVFTVIPLRAFYIEEEVTE